MTGTRVDALSTGDLATVGIVATVVLVVVGVLLSLLITKLLARVFIAVIVIILAALVWVERSHVETKAKEQCSKGASYFGFHVDPPQACTR